MYEGGELTRIGRGLYALPGDAAAGAQTLALVAARIPGAVVCLVSALAFHNVTTQVSDRVWIAVGHRARRPALSYPPIELVRMSEATLSYGVERHNIGGVAVSVFSPAKTVADCFKYRNRVGLDVAIEALRDVWQRRLCTVDELEEAARMCRVSRVMRPYIEATV
jgi:predicted transcriptional regulator of viral defense system